MSLFSASSGQRSTSTCTREIPQRRAGRSSPRRERGADRDPGDLLAPCRTTRAISNSACAGRSPGRGATTGASASWSSTWEQGGGSTLVAAGERIRTAVRATDIASHRDEGRFAIILPEVAEADAERLHRRLQFALGGRVDSGADGVRIHAGLVELRAEDDATVFRERAEAALERAKQAAADRLSAAQ
ncbi:MAG TPA: diguanylate cyclase [Gaiellaceae bacterium]|nr:diguanylate cyclase [Gaiellaceae bacterium]